MMLLKNKFSLQHVCLSFCLCMAAFSCSSEEPGGEGPIDPPIEEPPVDQPTDPNLFYVAKVDLRTQNNAAITSKEEYIACTVAIDGGEEFDNYSGSARIRGRGNSTWHWYQKKPYRIKLDEQSEILGLGANKDWVLLANYRDPTHLMNAIGFEMAHYMELPFTNHSRFVEVTLNGSYIGLYQLTEQIEIAKSRVNIDSKEGLLLSLDKDDGPELSPSATDNFWSSIFRLPVIVKSPEDQTSQQLDAIKADFAKLETAINNFDYNAVDKLLDIRSLIDYLLIQEMTYNVEVDAPRSIYMYKDKGGKYAFGPVWDFDAGFDFDWGSMYTGHKYFASYKELVLGTDPVNHTGGYWVNNFFTQMFRNKTFKAEYKARWTEVSDGMLDYLLPHLDEIVENASDAMKRDATRWPIDKSYTTEIKRLKTWLTNRADYLDTVIANIP